MGLKGDGYMNYTYILKCRDNSLYTGWTNDIDKRLKAHNDGKAPNIPNPGVRLSSSTMRNTRRRKKR